MANIFEFCRNNNNRSNDLVRFWGCSFARNSVYKTSGSAKVWKTRSHPAWFLASFFLQESLLISLPRSSPFVRPGRLSPFPNRAHDSCCSQLVSCHPRVSPRLLAIGPNSFALRIAVIKLGYTRFKLYVSTQQKRIHINTARAILEHIFFFGTIRLRWIRGCHSWLGLASMRIFTPYNRSHGDPTIAVDGEVSSAAVTTANSTNKLGVSSFSQRNIKQRQQWDNKQLSSSVLVLGKAYSLYLPVSRKTQRA